MRGLLYKDFLCVRGKELGLFLVAQFLILSVLRFANRNDGEMDVVIFMLYSLFMMMAFGYVLFGMDMALFRQEKGARGKRYYFSLPVSKRQYVAEKYLFVLIALYIIISLGYFEGMVCQTFCVPGVMGEGREAAPGMEAAMESGMEADGAMEAMGMAVHIAMVQGMLPVLGGVCLLTCAIEFAFIFSLGVERGLRAKTGLVLILFFAFMLYMLFGDLEILDRWNMETAILYLQEHPGAAGMLILMGPLFGGGCYALSYRFSAWRFGGREDWTDD